MSGLAPWLYLPGFLLLAVAGLLLSWADRKLAARLQWRQGPPLLQPWYDLHKLLRKETLVPVGATTAVFVVVPFIALSVTVLATVGLLTAWYDPQLSYAGDLLVYLYLYLIPPVCLMLGGSASANPYAALGASREMKLIIAYEVPFFLAVLAVAARAGGLSLSAVSQGPGLLSLSGPIAGLVALTCMQAKTGLSPFDLGEAETELAGGMLVEYSGPLLAVWKLTRAMYAVGTMLFIAIVFGGGGPALLLPVKVAVIAVLALSARILFPRVRIDHAVRFFLGRLAPLALVAALIAVAGG